MGLFDGAFEAAVSEIESIHSEQELRIFLGRLLRQYDLKHAVYHGVTLPGISKSNSVLILTYPRQWVERYIEKDYFTVDPVVAAGATSLLPVDWANLDKRGPRARQLFGEANELRVGTPRVTFSGRGAAGDPTQVFITTQVSAAGR